MFLTTQLRRTAILGVLVALAVVTGLMVAQTPAQAQGACQYEWFFGSQARPVNACPSSPPISADMAHLEFERGEMFWNSAENVIYVLYRDFQQPYWESFNDTYVQGMAERQAGLVGPLGLWQQPRRGFGNLWRTNPTVKSRLGWALEEWEQSYEGWLQKADTPQGQMVFFMREDGKVLQLQPSAQGIWDVFTFLG